MLGDLSHSRAGGCLNSYKTVSHTVTKSSSICKWDRKISSGINYKLMAEVNFMDIFIIWMRMLKHPLPSPHPILYTPKSGWAQKISLLKHNHGISQDPPSSSHFLWGLLAFPSRWTFPWAGSLLQVGVCSLELAGQPSRAGGWHRQRACRCSRNVLLVVPIPCCRVSALSPRDHDFPPVFTPYHVSHLWLACFIGVRDRRKRVGKRLEESSK